MNTQFKKPVGSDLSYPEYLPIYNEDYQPLNFFITVMLKVLTACRNFPCGREAGNKRTIYQLNNFYIKKVEIKVEIKVESYQLLILKVHIFFGVGVGTLQN